MEATDEAPNYSPVGKEKQLLSSQAAFKRSFASVVKEVMSGKGGLYQPVWLQSPLLRKREAAPDDDDPDRAAFPTSPSHSDASRAAAKVVLG
jgi:hypothetical protein